MDAKRLSASAVKRALALVAVVMLGLMIGGAVLGYELAGTNRFVGVGVGCIFGSALGTVLCRVGGLVARGMLVRRGYDVSPRRRASPTV